MFRFEEKHQLNSSIPVLKVSVGFQWNAMINWYIFSFGFCLTFAVCRVITAVDLKLFEVIRQNWHGKYPDILVTKQFICHIQQFICLCPHMHRIFSTIS
jgi:hypothetical protein